MALAILTVDHIQIMTPAASFDACRAFYHQILGFAEIDRPPELTSVGAWYRTGSLDLHLSLEETTNNHASRRHICYLVADQAAAKVAFQAAGVAILLDQQPVAGWSRFYVRDPAGNRLEIATPDHA